MKLRIITLGIIMAIFLVGVTIGTNSFKEHTGLTYKYDESTFHEYTVEVSGYVIFRCDITVKNQSRSNQQFTMKADMSRDMGLVQEKYAVVYKEASPEPEVFEIAANHTVTYAVEFKALHGDKMTKEDRMPPGKVLFTLQ
jgi:hypothetical protein